MIPYGHQLINQQDINEVVKVLKSDWLTQGPRLAAFERALAKYCGAKFCVALTNGTAALHLAYLASEFKPGDEVITTPNTFVATANMLLEIGVKPVFGDIRLDTYNLDERGIERLITKKTKAIVPVHLAGQPCEMKTIHRLAKKHRLLVIEDASHALGAKYQGRRIGACVYSDMAIFSFHPVKSITTGEGGAILTNSKKIYDKLRLLRNHGIYKNKAGRNVMIALGYNYRLTDLQAALGISQLKKVDYFVSRRRQIADFYQRALAGLPQIILPQEIKGNFSAWHLYLVRIKPANLRSVLTVYLKKRGIGVNFHYPAVYRHPYYRRHGFKKTSLVNEEIYHHSCLTLPCFPDLTKKQVNEISQLIKDFFSGLS